MCHAWPHTARSAPGPCLAFVPRVAALRPLHPAWPLCHVWLHASLEPLLLPTRGFNTQGSTPLNQSGSGSGRTSPRAASAASASRGSPASRSSKRPREQAAGEEGAEEEGAEAQGAGGASAADMARAYKEIFAADDSSAVGKYEYGGGPSEAQQKPSKKPVMKLGGLFGGKKPTK